MRLNVLQTGRECCLGGRRLSSGLGLATGPCSGASSESLSEEDDSLEEVKSSGSLDVDRSLEPEDGEFNRSVTALTSSILESPGSTLRLFICKVSGSFPASRALASAFSSCRRSFSTLSLAFSALSFRELSSGPLSPSCSPSRRFDQGIFFGATSRSFLRPLLERPFWRGSSAAASILALVGYLFLRSSTQLAKSSAERRTCVRPR